MTGSVRLLLCALLWMPSMAWAQSPPVEEPLTETEIIEGPAPSQPQDTEEESLVLLVTGSTLLGAGVIVLVAGVAGLTTVYAGLPYLPLQPFESEASRRNLGQYGTILGVGATVAGVVGMVIGGGLIVGHYALE